MSSSTRWQYRITCRRPGERAWTYRPFVGSETSELERITARLQCCREDAKRDRSAQGRRYRLEKRLVTITTGEWEVE